MGKNVAVFVDVANIFYAAKAAGVDIDYVTLLKSATAGRDLVRAYAYTGLDPDNENQRNFHEFLRRSNYKVVSKDIRKYGDGKVKANLDIELVVDMMKTARNLDIAIVVSGDGDFAPAIRAVQEMGVRCEVISFRGNTSSDLIEVADLFTDIIQLARVEKGSRSGRRVAEDDADLSMTEVPDKLTEGTGSGRGGRSRSRGRFRDEEPAAAGARGRRDRGAPAAAATPARAEAAGTVVALPGERLARAAGGLTEADLAAAEVFTMDDLEEPTGGAVAAAGEPAGSVESREVGEDGEPRRRRRRGGRGRGRGRGRAEDALGGQEDQPGQQEVAQPAPRGRAPESPRPIRPEDEEMPAARRAPRSTPFGSVWDSQLGTPVTPAAASLPPLPDDEDFDEPEIPEYLIAEQRRGANRGGGGRGGPRGGRSAYQSAMDRERYGRGGGGGINRYPDVSARTRAPEPRREDRGYSRPDRTPPPPRTSNEPWSDVPPELEAMLRAQVAQKPVSRPVPRPEDTPVPGAEVAETAAPATSARAVRKPSTRPTRAAATTTTAVEPTGSPTNVNAGVDSPGATAEAATATPKRRPGRPPKSAAISPTTPASDADAPGTADPVAPASPARVRAPRKPAAAAGATATRATAAKRTPKAAVTAADEPSPAGGTSADAPPAAKRRTTRKTATTDPA